MAQPISKKETTQTAVDWLVDKLIKGEFINNPNELIQQAKEMEKEQIMDAYGQGYVNAQNYEEIGREQYYKETYGS